MKEKIRDFLVFCSGSDGDIINNKCISEKGKYTKIGLTILMTAFFATIAMSYALFKVFYIDSEAEQNLRAYFISISLGIVWGVLIFSLDRFIVSSMKKTGNFFNEFLTALPRILIACLVSFTISQPIEVKLFEKQIKGEIINFRERQKEENTKNEKAQVDSASSEIKLKSKEEDAWRAKSNSIPAYILSYNNEAISAHEIYMNTEATKQNNETKIRRLNGDKEAYKRALLQETDATKIQNCNSLIKSIELEVAKYTNENLELQGKMNQEYAREVSLNNIFESEKQNYLNGVQKNLEIIAGEKEKLKIGEDKKLKIYTTKCDTLNFLYKDIYDNHFLFQLKFLNVLINKDENKGLLYAHYLIILLFLTIEIAPVFVKLISQKGSYDYVLSQEHEKEKFIASIKKMLEIYKAESDMNIEALEKHRSEVLKLESEKKLLVEKTFIEIQHPIAKEVIEQMIKDWQKTFKADPTYFESVKDRLDKDLGLLLNSVNVKPAIKIIDKGSGKVIIYFVSLIIIALLMSWWVWDSSKGDTQITIIVSIIMSLVTIASTFIIPNYFLEKQLLNSK